MSFGPCQDNAAFECGTVPVPLDRAGAVGGEVPLFVKRLRPEGATGQSPTALLALAGGPGQAATPLATSFAIALAPALRTRDMLVFDQRGTGQSGALDCPSLRSTSTEVSAVTQCASSLGSRRAFYRTLDSVEDIEAMRAAAGYEQLSIYGVSYGTKVALDYAAKYPQRVERLVLDSVVPPEGPDPLLRSSLVASRRVLQELCSNGACRRATPDVTADVTALAGRSVAARGRYLDGRGKSHRAALRGSLIYSLFQAGDLNPAVRAQLPAALRSARRGDATPLLRLAVSVFGAPSASQVADSGTNDAVFLATTCEEARLPWERSASPPARAQQAADALIAQPQSAFAPFTRTTVIGVGILRLCQGWPNATPPPADPAPVPDVPALVLNGTADLRTPLEDAQRVAAALPRAQVVGVPFVGHSVLGSDLSGCAGAAIAGFFGDTGVQQCPVARPVIAPITRAPLSVRTLGTTGRVRGAPGRTLTALLRTVDDALLQALSAELGNGATRIGGLRHGSIVRAGQTLRLRGDEFVPGVRVTGSVASDRSATFTVTGRRAARGKIRIATSGVLSGRLGGKRIRITPKAAAASLRVAPRDVLRLPALVRG